MLIALQQYKIWERPISHSATVWAHEQSTVAEHPLYQHRGGCAAEDFSSRWWSKWKSASCWTAFHESTEPAEQDCSGMKPKYFLTLVRMQAGAGLVARKFECSRQCQGQLPRTRPRTDSSRPRPRTDSPRPRPRTWNPRRRPRTDSLRPSPRTGSPRPGPRTWNPRPRTWSTGLEETVLESPRG